MCSRTSYEILVKARSLITPFENFTIGILYDPDYGHYCSLGALAAADDVDLSRISFLKSYCFQESPALKQALAYLASSITAKYRDNALAVSNRQIIYRFNDSRSTGHKDILAAFDRAIETAAKAEGIYTEVEELERNLPVDSALVEV